MQSEELCRSLDGRLFSSIYLSRLQEWLLSIPCNRYSNSQTLEAIILCHRLRKIKAILNRTVAVMFTSENGFAIDYIAY